MSNNRLDARAVLLSALDQLDNIKDRDGEAAHVYLVCAYAYQVEGKTTFGWSCTDDPSFITAGLLRVVAENIELDEPREDLE